MSKIRSFLPLAVLVLAVACAPSRPTVPSPRTVPDPHSLQNPTARAEAIFQSGKVRLEKGT